MHRVDLNVDLGESFGNYTLGNDEEIIPLVSSVNVACGFHAGDPLVMSNTIKLVKNSGKVALGAHPGYPDLQGFGRRYIAMDEAELEASILYQLSAIDGLARIHGVELKHVKPHGALYNATFDDYNLSLTIANAIKKFNPNLKLMGLSGGNLVNAGKKVGLSVVNEVFADRAYMDDGSLMPRKLEGSLISNGEEAIQRIIKMVKEGTVESSSGNKIEIIADSICIHGDGKDALAFVRKIRKEFKVNNITINNT